MLSTSGVNHAKLNGKQLGTTWRAMSGTDEWRRADPTEMAGAELRPLEQAWSVRPGSRSRRRGQPFLQRYTFPLLVVAMLAAAGGIVAVNDGRLEQIASRALHPYAPDPDLRAPPGHR